ncbi:MAG: HupE/UreJ family protein [Halothiobacillaceae bacterium]
MTAKILRNILLLALPFCSAPVFAHAGHSLLEGGLVNGLLHPLLGLDHLVALIAIGVWSGLLAPAAWRWFLPLMLLGLLAGTVAGLMGTPVPGVETGILLSILVVGLLMAAMVRLPAWGAALICGAFMVFHGAAHGLEMQPGVDALAYVIGLVLTSAAVVMAGHGLGLAVRGVERPVGRFAGVGFLLVGGVLLLT